MKTTSATPEQQYVIFSSNEWTVAEAIRRTVSGLGMKATRTWSRRPGQPKNWHVTVSATSRRRLLHMIDRVTNNATQH